MSYRISPVVWPVLAIASPIIVPMLAARHRRYRKNLVRADRLNGERMQRATKIDLPPVDRLELTPLVEQVCTEGFKGESGISYLVAADTARLLFDVSYGAAGEALTYNAALLNFDIARTDGLAVSHLHPDHMGGSAAMKKRHLKLPPELGEPVGLPCYFPDRASASGFDAKVVIAPGLLAGGIFTTGPLARSLFFTGLTEEQALLVNVQGKGLVVITGCGHMTIPLLLELVGRLTDLPLYALIGGMHLPLTASRAVAAGFQVQMLAGTGLPPWRRIKHRVLSETVVAINDAAPRKVLLSAHDSCDYALGVLKQELKAETEVLEAGRTYCI